MKEFKELKARRKFSLLLGDCIVDDFDRYCSKLKIKNLHAVKIQGGWEGNVKYSELEGCECFILINAWARGAQVIDDNEMWLKRISNQCAILESIVLTGKPFLFIERAGLPTRYINLEYRKLLDEKYLLNPKELGIPDAILEKEGWKPQPETEQTKRLKSYREFISKTLSSENLFYYDLQDIMSASQIFKYCGENNHHGGVVNSAPWHFREPWAECMYSIVNHFILTKQKPKLKQTLNRYLL